MKRFLKFFVAIVASAMTLFSCENKELEQILAQIAFDKASYEIGAEGGQLTVEVLTTVDWTAALSAATSLDNIEGITLAAEKGKGSSEPIEIVVNFDVNDGFDRTVKLSLSGGGVSGSCTITQKGSAVREMEKVTVAQFLEKAEDASIYYELKGIVKSITNTDYSNFVMKDIDGDAEILIYGLAYESDVANQKVQLLTKEGIQEGDIITIASTRGSYNGTPEGMNSYYISHEKSATPMLRIDKETYEASASGEVFDLTVTSNIVTWTLSTDVDWISFEPATGNASTTVKVTVAAGEGGTGTITASADGLESVTCVVTRADLTVLTIAEFLTKPDDPNKAYQIGGIITDIVMDRDDATKPNKYGNFHIKDHTGEAYIYGLLPEKGGNSGQDVITEKGLKIGDFVSLAAPKSSFNDDPQGKNAWLLAAYPAKTLTEFLALEDDATKSVFYTVSGTVTSIAMDKDDATKPNKYGNIYIKDADGDELYIYGVLDWKGKTANFESLGVKVGDVITGYAYKSSFKETPQAVNLQPVIIESGEPVVEDRWDYTPGAEYNADLNLWKPIFDGEGDLFCGKIAEWEKDVPAARVAGITKEKSTYVFHFNEATEGDWSNCNFLAPAEDYALRLSAGKTYKISYVIGADKPCPRAFIKLTAWSAEGNHEDNTAQMYEYTMVLDPSAPVVVSNHEFSGVDCGNISFTFDFGGNPADVNIYLKDLTIIEAGQPVLNFGWTEATVVNDTVAFDAEGAAHWYIQKDAGVEYSVEVVDAAGSVITEGVTIERDADHIAINYAKNTTPYAKVWRIVATSTSNVENRVLTATLTQGAYEYTDLAKVNEAILDAGNNQVPIIVNIPADDPLEVTRVYTSTDKNGKTHRSVFIQNSTGALLLYDVLEAQALSEYKQVTGRFTVTGTVFKGLPEITKIAYTAGELSISSPEHPKYYCFDLKSLNLTLADVIANYNKFVNAKVKFYDMEVTKAFSKSEKEGEVKDAAGTTIAIYSYASNLEIEVPAGTKAEYVVGWPTFYNKKQIGLYDAAQCKITSIPSTITMPATLDIVKGSEPVALGATTNSPAPITYTVNPAEGVLTVGEDGTITLAENVEVGATATITASVVAATPYLAGEATCVVTVTEGGGGGETVDPYSIDLTYRLGTNAYDDGVATVNETENVKVIKIGTSSKKGEFTVVIPAGTKKITYYAVGWTGKTTTLDFQINGASAAQQALVANAGATGNSPFTLTVTDADKYEIVNDFAVETPVVVTTTTNARAILFGLKAE